jgi:putative signal transducing protein
MEKIDLVPVFAAGDPVAVAMAKAVLESAGIPFVSKGEGVQDLLGVGRFPGGFNIATGPVQFLVRRGDAARAQALLDDAGRRSRFGSS